MLFKSVLIKELMYIVQTQRIHKLSGIPSYLVGLGRARFFQVNSFLAHAGYGGLELVSY